MQNWRRLFWLGVMKRMAKNRKLGMGLDLLLTGGEVSGRAEDVDIIRVREIMNQALKQDEDGHFLEAYFLYRKIIELLPDKSGAVRKDDAQIFSQALNNAAIILFEHGEVEKSCLYLERSLSVQTDNQVAASNLEQIKFSIISNKGG